MVARCPQEQTVLSFWGHGTSKGELLLRAAQLEYLDSMGVGNVYAPSGISPHSRKPIEFAQSDAGLVRTYPEVVRRDCTLEQFRCPDR